MTDSESDEPVMPKGNQGLQRASTQALQSQARLASRVSIGCGFCLLLFMGGIAAAYFYYSTQVPATCNREMDRYFFGQGIITAVTAVLIAVMTCGMAEMFQASSHQMLMKKYQEEHRLEEAAEQAEEFEQEAKTAGVIMGGAVCLLYVLSVVGSGWLIYGIVQAVKADSNLCGDSVTVFWILCALQVLNTLSNMCKGGAGMQQRT